jgi:ATP-binding protein involved in chromosome partitioning
MASFECPHCHHTTAIFRSGGVEREAKNLGIEVLGSVPLNEGICVDADTGKPSVVADGKRGEVFRTIADEILVKLKLE